MSSDANFLATILAELCGEMDAELELEKDYSRAGFVTFRGGRRCFFKNACFDINAMGAAQIAKDKDYCAKFLNNAGLNTPVSRVVFAPKAIAAFALKNPALGRRLAAQSDALKAAAELGFPLFVKPNEGAEGRGVQLIHSNDQLLAHLNSLYQAHDLVLLQKPVPGDDHRVIVLDGEVVAAYLRKPLGVRGNGTDTIAELLLKRRDDMALMGRPTDIKPDDPRILQYIDSQGLNIQDVIEDGASVRLLANANLSSGGDVVDVIDTMDTNYKRISVQAAAAVGLRFAGVDILCQAIDHYDDEYSVLEVNAAPGLSNYGASGARGRETVIDLYRKLLSAMEAGDPA
jgi:D-alanine-D-alanine ligase-like ATP-grasp enzyme